MTEPLRLLRLTPAFDWRTVDGAGRAAEAIGGMAVQVALQVRGTAARGIDQEVITMAVRGAPSSARVGERVTVQAAGRALARGVHRRNGLWLLGVLRAMRHHRRPDVVHVHASGLVEPLLACIGARLLLRRPVVLTLHCSALVTYVTQSRIDAVVQVFTRAAERIAVGLSARTLVLTERVATALGDRAEAMPDWVETERFARAELGDAAREFAAAHALPLDRPVALFVGRVSREKGWPVLPRLAARLAERRLHVLVCGDGDELPALAAQAGELGVADAFTFANAVPREGVAAAMACADVLVLPSAHEELGSVLIEAMAAGLPSVAYAVGGTSEAIEQDVTGLLVPGGDEAGLAAAVLRVLDDPALTLRAREAGPERARTRFDAGAGSERLAALYAELAEPGAASPPEG